MGRSYDEPAGRSSAVGFGCAPPALSDFAGTGASPAVARRVKPPHLEADNPTMDAHGAKLLAARIRAGVSVGMRIELVQDPEAHPSHAGDTHEGDSI